MQIDRIKKNPTQNRRKSNSEARISRNSGVGDTPDSPERRERESWDSVLVLPRLPVLTDGIATVLIFGARGLPISIYDAMKTRPEGLIP